MTLLIGLPPKKAGQGFTLIELLLATVLLMLLLGAMVFSYSTLQRGAALDEGATQFEALLRYAQAQAATTGRKVQLVFEENIAEDVTLSFGRVKMMWEPEPLTQPGQWVNFPGASELVNRIVDLVQIEAVRPFDPGQPPPPLVTTMNETRGADRVPPSRSGDSLSSSVADQAEASDYQPPIMFFPDGSSDSAEITLASVESEDSRRITLRLIGITGTIKRLVPVDETEMSAAQPEETKKQKPDKSITTGTIATPPPEIPATPPVTSSTNQ